MKKEGTALADFNWDDDNFFATEEVETKVETPKKDEVKEETEDDIEEDVDTDEDETEDDDFFNIEEDVEEKSSTVSYTDIYKKLKDKGTFSKDVEGELDEDAFIELQEEEISARIEESFKDFSESLDDEAATFLKFKKAGGSTKEFFGMYTSLLEVPVPTKGDDSSHERFLKYYYKAYDSLDEEDIEDKIEWAKESGKLEKYAMKFYSEVEEEKQEQIKESVKNQEEAQKNQELNRQAFIKDLKDLINSSDKIDDWSISKEDKKDLHSYMTKGVEKVGNQVLSKLQSDLQEVFRDKNKLVKLAKILKSDFDLKDLKEKAKSDVIKETKKTIKTGNSPRKTTKSLADFF